MQHDPQRSIIEKWRTANSADYAYYDKFEDKLGVFWLEGRVFHREFSKLDLHCTVEIACGKGRHAAQIADRCERLILADTSIDAIASVRERFREHPQVEAHVIEDGQSLPFVADAAVTAVFSYDSMVHFEPTTVYAYLREIERVLVPGGRALLHHSNYSDKPDQAFNLAPGWRNFMTTDLMRHYAHRSGLRIESHQLIDWSTPASDALTLLLKPAANEATAGS